MAVGKEQYTQHASTSYRACQGLVNQEISSSSFPLAMATADMNGRRDQHIDRALIWQQGSIKNASFSPSLPPGEENLSQKVCRGREGIVLSTIVLGGCCQIRALAQSPSASVVTRI